MVDGLVTAGIVTALVAAAFTGLLAVLGRPPQLPHLVGLAVFELVLVVQALVAMGRVLTGDRPQALATFVGYLLTALLIPPLGVLFGWSERTRWGSVIISATCVVAAVMMVRLQQIWQG